MKTAKCQPLAYRPDIDGLRAFAVLSVVAYHAFPEWVKGGFIGVDVFFVISGYLIGGIILRELEQGSFSFWNFYSRRIRRIFPALIVVLASALAFGWFALLPDEFKSLGKHVLGGSTFVSNFVLWQEAGYFDTAAKAKPLLHLWSLGIEEQFYIFFPLLLWFCHRKRIGKFPCIVILVACSFLYNLSLHTADRTADFYSPLTRIWELLAGVLCMMAMRHQGVKSSPPGPLLRKEPGGSAGRFELPCAFLGILCLAISLCSINDQMPYPGWRALTPVAGALCLLGAGNRNVINNYLFSNKISVFIGRVSYPLYLWHWVLLSFAFIVHGDFDSGDFALRVWLVCLSFIFAVLTYFFIENPIRFNQKYLTIKIVSLIIFMIVLGCSGAFIFITEGSYCRLTGLKNSKVIEIEKKYDNSKKTCLDKFKELRKLGDNICAMTNNDNSIKAFIGDSHSEHLFVGMLNNNKYGYVNFNMSCMVPYLNTTNKQGEEREQQEKFKKFVFDYIAGNKKIDTVILSHHPACSFLYLIDTQDESINDVNIALENGMRRTFDFLIKNNKKIIVVLDNPELPFEHTKCTNRKLKYIGTSKTCRFNKSHFEMNISRYWYENYVNMVKRDYKHVKILDLSDLLCDDKYCYISKDGNVLYKDKNHLSIYGSLYVSNALLKLMTD